MTRCPDCGNGGWVLDMRIDKEPMMADLLPCIRPDCEYAGRDLRSISVHLAGFTSVAMSPGGNFVMSVSR